MLPQGFFNRHRVLFVSRRREGSVLHPQDQVGGIRHLRVVGHHDDIAAFLVGQLPEDLHDDVGVLPVQVSRGFVRQEDGSTGVQAPDDG